MNATTTLSRAGASRIGLALVSRYLLALPLAIFGFEDVFFGTLRGGVPPAPPWTPAAHALAYAIGALLLLAAIGLAANVRAQWCALVAGAFFILCALVLHGAHAHDIVFDAQARTGGFEALSMGCSLIVLASLLPGDLALDRAALVARFAFAFSMIVFGIQHFMLAAFIASLITPWIPAHLFFAYLTGVGFVAAGVAIAIGLRAHLASLLLAAMLLSWVVVLHLPRCLAAWSNADEWTSLFVAMGIGAGSLAMARYMTKPR